MRYIADANGYLKEVSFGCDIVCNGVECTEYTGGVPSGFKSLPGWFAAEADKLYRWKIVNGELTKDADAKAPDNNTALPIVRGGTGADTAVDALTNLGALNLGFITDDDYMIKSGDDVNDYLTPGAFRCPSAAVAETLKNGPPRKDTGFRLIVSAQSSTYGVVHIAILNTSYTEIYIRTMTTTDTWGAWVRLTHSGERKIAYEFPNQTSTFNAQTVKPSGYANYDAMLVCARLSTGTAIEVPPVLIRKGGNGANLYGVLSGKIVRRTVTFTEDGIEFAAAGQISTYGGSFANLNTSLIPTVMYGLKGVI